MSYRNKFEKIIPLAGERWRLVVGWPYYMVSNKGRVKSIKRVIFHIGGKKMHEGDYLLNLKPNKKGYLKVKLYNGSLKKTFGVHQLVALHFKKRPSEPLDVHHKDGDKLNNIPSNLAWLTKKAHADITRKETAFGRGLKGESHGCAKIDSVVVLKIRNLYSTEIYSMGDLAKSFSLTKTHISRIINRKSWAHI